MRLALAHRIACGALGLLVAGCLAAMPAWGKSPATVHRAGAQPRCGSRPATDPWLHVVWIVMENHGYGNVIGSPEAPYLNALARHCGLATDYHAITHPSLPNYIAMTSGSTQGITDDGDPAVNATGAPSIFSELPGRWVAYAESMRGRCEHSDSGNYAVRHDPAVYYTRLASACRRYVRSLPRHPSIAAFTFVAPNLCHDMHDCPVATGDRWLRGFLPKLLAKRSYRRGRTAIFITWDEDGGSGGNRVPLIALARSVPHGARPGGFFTHYSLLRTTEDMLGLSPLAAAAGAPSMRGAFGL